MSIRSQLQSAYFDIYTEIHVNAETSKEITLSDICILIESDYCELTLDPDITNYFENEADQFRITKNFENMIIVIMLFIISGEHIFRGIYFSYNGKKIIYDCSEFIELSRHFGSKYCIETKNIIKMISPYRSKYNPETLNNIKNYLGLVQNPKSARSSQSESS